MHLYDKFFGDYDKTVAQILISAESIGEKERKEHLISLFNALLEWGIIPIVNENDSVSSAGLESDKKLSGDKDMLSAVIAILCQAKQLILLSNINGLYDANPRESPAAKIIPRIERIDENVYTLAERSSSQKEKAALQNKLRAAALATAQGIDTTIASGKKPDALFDILEGRSAGTLFAGAAP